jgi:hypothetical protein
VFFADGTTVFRLYLQTFFSELHMPDASLCSSAAAAAAAAGPNTGGKTATMKALGLATCMAKVGMMLPAAGARCVVFVYQGGGGA